MAAAAAVVCISVHPDSPRWLTVADSGDGADGRDGGDGGGDAVATAAAVVGVSVHTDSRRRLTVAMELTDVTVVTVVETLCPLPLLLSACVEAE